MQYRTYDIVVIGGGGAGLRAAIAIAERDPTARVALLSKVYPMRSHTVAAEGGAAGVARPDDDLDAHFRDTVAGGDWLCDQPAVRYFVEHATEELVQLERWGCPWSREADGSAAVRRFGGMSRPRTWFAADKSGFHILHTLFQTSMRWPSIERVDEVFCTDLIVDGGRCHGAVGIVLRTGEPVAFLGRATVLATGGAGRIYRHNTNGGIVTGDGMAMALRAGASLRDLEFVQFHPTALPASGVLITEAARGEGGVLLNAAGERYLERYGLGPVTPLGQPRTKHMELGPRDRLSQAFWHEQREGRTADTPHGPAVWLDLRHLGPAQLAARLPLICELARLHVGVDPVHAPIPVRPAMHYSMGGIATGLDGDTGVGGLFAVGECASVGLHGANRLGSNSLAELLVFGRRTGEAALRHAAAADDADTPTARAIADEYAQRALSVRGQPGTESLAAVRRELGVIMDERFGIYRDGGAMQEGIGALRQLRERAQRLRLRDASAVFNTEHVEALELVAGLEVALALATAAVARRESRGAHQRLDGYPERDDQRFLAHSVVSMDAAGEPALSFDPVRVTEYPPARRVYGAASEAP